jgi:hypothetical protein
MKSMYTAICSLIFLVGIGGGPQSMTYAADTASKHVLLIGASVGNTWDIAHLPERTKLSGYTFESVAEYKFDKSEVVSKVIREGSSKPDFVVLKECAAYFPGDLSRYKQLLPLWVATLRAEHITPILATVVPVTTPEFFSMSYVKHLVKKVTRNKIPVDERLPYLLEYNDWIRTYAAQEGLVVLDLELALRTDAQERKLRADLADEDGLHLNDKAYRILDRLVFDTAEQLFQKGS